MADESLRLEQEIKETLRLSYRPYHLDLDTTKLFLQKLRDEDARLMGFLANIFIRGYCPSYVMTGYFEDEIYGPPYAPEGKTIYKPVHIAVYLAEKNRIAELTTLLNCGLWRGDYVFQQLCNAAIKHDNVDVYKLLDMPTRKTFVRERYFKEFRKVQTPKIADYLLNKPKYGALHFLPTDNYTYNDIVFYLVLHHIDPQVLYQEYVKNFAKKTDIAKKIQAYMRGITLHQLCIVTLYCRKVEVPDWFPKVLLEFSLE